ncbi:hypothetical protein [Gymnodinialimonas sp.]
MTSAFNDTPVPGWVGGFAQSNPAFAYPSPDLSSLPLLDNLDNIDKLDRQQDVLWPEFSWLTIPGDESSRCFQMFAPDISRLGYTNEGRVYSIICPQQGTASPTFGAINVEVTVTGQRGWVDEETKSIAAELTVEGKIWFSPGADQNGLVRLAWELFANSEHPFPSSKENAIRVRTHLPGDPNQPVFPLRDGASPLFQSPKFATHADQAWSMGHIDVEIGEVHKVGDEMVDDFNAMILEVFNLAKGNILADGTILSWNVWFTAPEHVNRAEWRNHAEVWRHSIDADHGSPDGPGTDPVYFDGSPLNIVQGQIDHEIALIKAWLKKHLFD